MVHVKLLLLPSFVTGFLKNFSSVFILVQLLIPPEHYASVTNLFMKQEKGNMLEFILDIIMDYMLFLVFETALLYN